MEKSRRDRMVNNQVKWTIVETNDIKKAKYRLEASVFNIEAKNARQVLSDCKYKPVRLWSEYGYVSNAFYPGRFKRIYVNKDQGHPMILPSQMISVCPKPTKYISSKTFSDFDLLVGKKNTLLLTRSGTIGNITIVSRELEGKVLSDDIIRVNFNNEYELGYTYAYLKTKIGRLILETNNYGSVIQHIEPEHLQEILIPDAPNDIKQKIHDIIMQSFELRDMSNNLIKKGEELLTNELKLPPVEKIKSDYYDNQAKVKSYIVNTSLLNDRFDCSYHLPIVNSIIDYLLDNAKEIIPLGSSHFSQQIILAGVFKRVYVDREYGVPFLGGRDIMQLSPNVEKFLSLAHHKVRIKKELEVKENFLLITDRGTIGNVNIAPKHFEGWCVSQNVIKIIPSDLNNAGYLYIFLNSDYGQILIKRETYGSVIDMIDDKSVATIPIPILKNETTMNEINTLALKANNFRSEAYYLEQEAIRLVNEIIYNKH